MQHGVSFQRPLEGEVEVFDGFPGREPCRFDPQFTAVGLTGGHLSFQTGGEELFVAPLFLTGPFRQPVHCPSH